MRPDGLVVIAQYVWDGRPQTQVNSTHFLASAWLRRRGGPVLVANLCSWDRLLRWPGSLPRLLPGLHAGPVEGLFLLNRYGADWRQSSHEGRALPVDPVGGDVREACRRLGIRTPLLLAADPAHARLFGRCGEAFRIYYATDDLAAGDPARSASIRADEEAAVRSADLVMGVSAALCDRDRSRARSVLLLPNGVDAHGLRELARAPDAVPALRDIPPPRVVYLGYLNRRVDYPSLDAAARSRPGVSFVLVGPEDRQDAAVAAALDALHALPNVRFLGRRDRRALARILAECDLGIIPYRIDPFNAACSPLKALEYAALGLPVVASPLPALLPWAGDLRLVPGEGLGAALDEELPRARARRERMRAFADRETWEARVDRMMAAVAAPGTGPHGPDTGP